jgi:hypothetical protein
MGGGALSLANPLSPYHIFEHIEIKEDFDNLVEHIQRNDVIVSLARLH